MQAQSLTVVRAEETVGGGRYDFTKLPPSALKALYAKKKRNVRERARFLLLRGQLVVGFLLADYRVLVAGTRVVFLSEGHAGTVADGDAVTKLVLAAMGWARGFEGVAYVKVEAACLRALQRP